MVVSTGTGINDYLGQTTALYEYDTPPPDNEQRQSTVSEIPDTNSALTELIACDDRLHSFLFLLILPLS
jgi:hypothetical protein